MAMRTKRLFILPAAIVAVLISISPALADFYRYVDERGVVHITNVPSSAEYEWMMSESGGRSETPRLLSRSEYEDMISEKAILHGVDPALVKAIVKVESDFNPGAVSTAGARGLMQLMPETARLVGVTDIDDPEENVEGGIKYLSSLLDRYGHRTALAVAAYNAGETAVAKYNGIPPFDETREFVKRVLHYHGVYRGYR